MIALDLSLENLYRQYIHCRRNKRNTINALRFEVEQEKNLLDLREALVNQLSATLSSYLGHFKLANSWNLWQSIWRRYDFLAQYFEFDAKNWRLVRKYTAPQGLRQVKKQYRHFRWRFPDDALFFRVGRFVEFYDVGVSPVASQLGLDAIRKNRRGARSGFPYYQAGRHLKTLLDVGVGVVYIGEGDSPLGGIRLRVPLWRRVRVGRTDYQDIGCSEVVVPD